MNEAPAVAMHQDEAAAQPVVEFRDVHISFNGPDVLDGVSFAVGPRETRVLLGPAGVGKSVLLKTANGLICPDSGQVVLLGNDISQLRERDLFPLRLRTGMVFQEGALFDSLTVRDNVAYQLIQEEVPDEEIDSRVLEALRFVGLEQTFSLFPGSLSGGMRRRVAIARALIRQPELLLYDSPTGGLDPVTSTTIIELIVKQRDFYRTPSIMVTHRLQDAFTMCTHRFDSDKGAMVKLPEGETDQNTTFLMMNDGKILFDGSLHDLVHSEDPFVREFLE
ncbi:ABC transporter ATP-binding protein [Occallatibacter riparius]|uniref:ATP-binding cassette domain-containing protein n=1 Tax=Occallatibacter riparius TaxID=1002689 RepID=A0A9J7BLD0_9BACT|nr:ATP-binding cassette domain-containing protein [Occallatibacter riparius]UWZ82045.1 ATP-binding cassette domain-containing protein [Occallatibacter riparius]